MSALIAVLLLLVASPAHAKPRYSYACTIGSWPSVEEVPCNSRAWRKADPRYRGRFREQVR